MNQNTQDVAADNSEMASLLLGAGFALASLILLPAVAQRVGLGASLTIALRGALMRLGAPGSGGGSSAAPAPSGGTSSGSAGTGRVQTENLAPPPANRR